MLKYISPYNSLTNNKFCSIYSNLELNSAADLLLVSGPTNKINITANNSSIWNTTNGTITITSNNNDINIISGTTNNILLTAGKNNGNLIIDGTNLTIGNLNTSGLVNIASQIDCSGIDIGTCACPYTNIYGRKLNIGCSATTINMNGNMTLTGTTININMEQLSTISNIIQLNSNPIIEGTDAGFICRRKTTDVITDTTMLVISLASPVNLYDTTINILFSTYQTPNYFTGWVILIGSENFIIVTSTYNNNGTTTVFINGNTSNFYSISSTVTFFSSLYASLFYSETNKEFGIFIYKFHNRIIHNKYKYIRKFAFKCNYTRG